MQAGIEVDEFFVDEFGAPGEVLAIGGAAAFEECVEVSPFGEEGIDFPNEFGGACAGVDESMDALAAFDEGGGSG